MLNLKDMTEKEIFTALTSIDEPGFRPKIIPENGNKVRFQDVLDFFRGTDFTEFFELQRNLDTKKKETVIAYNTYVYERPVVQLLGKFIQAGFLDLNLNYKDKDKYLIPLGDDLLTKVELRRLNLCEGIILRDGDFLPVRHKEAHKIGSMWLYVHGYRLENMVRYTSSYLGEPYFSSMSDFVERSTNAIAFSSSQAVAMCNILVAKYPEVNSFADKFRDFTDLCMMPGADSYCMLNNLSKLQDLLGRENFDSQAIITEIRKEATLMGIAPAVLSTEPGGEE